MKLYHGDCLDEEYYNLAKKRIAKYVPQENDWFTLSKV